MKKGFLSILLLSISFAFNTVDGITNTPDPSSNYNSSNQVEGKVVKAYTQGGFGPRGIDWLFMDLQTKNGIVTVGIAPTFVISNLPIQEGDIVKVTGITPPIWPNGTIRAWDIYDVTQKKDYPIAGWGRGWRHGGYYK